MKVDIGSPKVTVTILSTRSKIVTSATLGDATSDLLMVTTSKDIGSPTGGFTLQFVPSVDKDKKTWFDKIHAFDYVEIKFKGIKDDKEKVVMRGLIDTVNKTESYESGLPERTITVSGRDLSILLTDFLIYYMPELGARAEGVPESVKSMLKVLAWKVMDKDKPNFIVSASEAFDFLAEEWSEEVDIWIQDNTHILKFVDWDAESFFPDARSTLFFLMSYEGPWWNAFQEYQDKPFHELFIYDTDDLCHFILRPARLKDAKGNYTPRVDELINRKWMYPDDFSIESNEKISMNLTKSAAEIYNFYLSVPTMELFTKEEFRAMAWSGNLEDPKLSINPYVDLNENSPSYLRKFGFRKMEAQTVYMNMDIGQFDNRGKKYVSEVLKPDFIGIGKIMNKTLVAWNLHNSLLLSGDIMIPGTNRAIIGTYMLDKDDGLEYYVEGVNHVFQVFSSFRTQLRLSRGMPPKDKGGLGPNANAIFFDSAWFDRR